jgi:hypothetical protein
MGNAAGLLGLIQEAMLQDAAWQIAGAFGPSNIWQQAWESIAARDEP